MSLLPPINAPAPSSTPSTNNLLRSDWNFSSVAENASWTTKGVLHADQSNSNGTSSTAVAAARPTSRLQTQRPSSKEFKNGLPPVYSKWLVQYWLYSNRARTVPVDNVNLSGWPIDKIVAGCKVFLFYRKRFQINSQKPSIFKIYHPSGCTALQSHRH